MEGKKDKLFITVNEQCLSKQNIYLEALMGNVVVFDWKQKASARKSITSARKVNDELKETASGPRHRARRGCGQHIHEELSSVRKRNVYKPS